MRVHEEDAVTLRGELDRWRLISTEGWGIGMLITGSGERVPFTGKTLGASIGETLEVTGAWHEHPKFGRQFKVKSCVTRLPESIEGVVRWLASALPDVGEARARKLLEHFGEASKLWEIIEHEPARLCEVHGITEARASAIQTAYFEQRESRDHMIALRGWGLTDNQIQKCMKAWGTIESVVDRIRSNPYELSRHVVGFGFKRADEVAKRAGVKHDAPERIEAGIVYTLELATSEGHCWMWGGALQKVAANDTLEVPLELVASGIRRASSRKWVVRRGKRIYTASIDVVEGEVARACVGLIQRSR